MKYFNRVYVAIATTGTGTITFGAAVTAAFLTPSEAGAANTDQVYYCLTEGNDFEIGIGTIGGTVSTLSRDTVLKAKIGGTAGTTKMTLAGAAKFRIIEAAEALTGLADDAIEFVIDGGGSVITTGMKGKLEVPFACTINSVTLLADQSGSIVVDIWKCTYAQYDAGATHPVSGDKITASAPPTISTATKAQDSTLTGWTKTLAKGDVLAFNVNSVTTVQRATLSLKVTR